VDGWGPAIMIPRWEEGRWPVGPGVFIAIGFLLFLLLNPADTSARLAYGLGIRAGETSNLVLAYSPAEPRHRL
jgi:hypothetical protein